ncbi:MAG TPA: TA system VapC family ribonuclease toxin [Microthrixaceae bacterium]|nr:TA system VapC family ribonuclease toxin [Microthrixaceae bacterium]
MRCVDVNVLVDAHRLESRRHESTRSWLEVARSRSEPLAVPGIVVSGFLRVVTHPRVFVEPTPVAEALGFVDALLASPASTWAEPGPRHQRIFLDLCAEMELRGNDVPDAYIAAIVIELGASLVTSDVGFARFPSLRWERPAA